MLFTNATWYNNYEPLTKATGLTNAILDQFYNKTVEGSFQWNLLDQDALNAAHFGCSDKTNCTSEELAFKQWGSYEITNNPRIYITSFNYMP